VSFTGGGNTLTVHDSALPKGVVINAGGGTATYLKFDNSKVAGSVTVNGNAGFEDIEFTGFKDSVAHDVVLTGGVGGTAVQSSAKFLTIGGKLSQTGDVDTNTLNIPMAR